MGALDVVTSHRDGRIAVLTLNRPAQRNAVNAAVARTLGDLLAACATDDDVAAIVLTGAGPTFCAGADLKAVAAGESIYDEEHRERGFAGLVSHFVDKPIIAAVNGFALGGGTEIVLACDLAVLSAEAHLGLPEVRRGLIAAAGGVLRLPEQIPPKIAAHMLLTGEPISAGDALRWGLVNAVSPPDSVLDDAITLAKRVAANAPLAVRTSKRMMAHRNNFGSSWSPDLWVVNAAEAATIRASADALEGARAFAEKRAPRWAGQ
ncbi:short chain enoyl-CoA hydratase [Mycobacteroides abscessus subsp. abscessus]|nr:short chain enoyl-CoA hydratase [Mycobacteroides abscessus subsp. abscessus]